MGASFWSHDDHSSAGDRCKSERGETLLEVLATVLLLGLGIVAVLGMVFLGVRVSNSYRKTTTASNQVADFAENLLQTGTGQTYDACTPAHTPSYQYTAVKPGYSIEIEKIEYLTSRVSASAQWQSSCPSVDQGLQKLHIKVVSPADTEEVERLIVVKRNRTCANSAGEQC